MSRATDAELRQHWLWFAQIPALISAHSLVVTPDRVSMLARLRPDGGGLREPAELELLPVLLCIPCQGDRPVVPLAGGAYRCSACGMLWDPSEPSC